MLGSVRVRIYEEQDKGLTPRGAGWFSFTTARPGTSMLCEEETRCQRKQEAAGAETLDKGAPGCVGNGCKVMCGGVEVGEIGEDDPQTAFDG